MLTARELQLEKMNVQMSSNVDENESLRARLKQVVQDYQAGESEVVRLRAEITTVRKERDEYRSFKDQVR